MDRVDRGVKRPPSPWVSLLVRFATARRLSRRRGRRGGGRLPGARTATGGASRETRVRAPRRWRRGDRPSDRARRTCRRGPGCACDVGWRARRRARSTRRPPAGARPPAREKRAVQRSCEGSDATAPPEPQSGTLPAPFPTARPPPQACFSKRRRADGVRILPRARPDAISGDTVAWRTRTGTTIAPAE